MNETLKIAQSYFGSSIHTCVYVSSTLRINFWLFSRRTYRDIPYDPKNNNSLLERMLLMSSSYTHAHHRSKREHFIVCVVSNLCEGRVLLSTYNSLPRIFRRYILYTNTHTPGSHTPG